MSVARWMVSVAALLVTLAGCADVRRPEKRDVLVEWYEDRGHDYAGQDEDGWWFLESVGHGSHGRTWWTYLLVERDTGEERTVVEPWPHEFEE